MCNLYSITTNQEAVIRLFRVLNRYVGNLPPMPGVFPDYPAPVVRNVGNDREMAMMRWGMPPPPRTGGPPVTNIRNTASPHQTASPVCGSKNFVSVRLYSAPQLHRTIVAILGICPRGTPDQPQYLCDHSPLGGVVRLEG